MLTNATWYVLGEEQGGEEQQVAGGEEQGAEGEIDPASQELLEQAAATAAAGIEPSDIQEPQVCTKNILFSRFYTFR